MQDNMTVKVKKGKSCLCCAPPGDYGTVVSHDDETVRIAWLNEKGTGKDIHRFKNEDVELG